MKTKLIYILLGITGAATGVYFYIKSKKNEGDTNKSGGGSFDPTTFGYDPNRPISFGTSTSDDTSNQDNADDIYVSPEPEDEIIEEEVYSDPNVSAWSDNTQNWTAFDCLLPNYYTSRNFTCSFHPFIANLLSRAGYQDDDKGRYWVFSDNYYAGYWSGQGKLGYEGPRRPPFKIGDRVYIQQEANATFPQYNAVTQIEGIGYKNNRGWIVDTTQTRLGNTPAEGGIMFKMDMSLPQLLRTNKTYLREQTYDVTSDSKRERFISAFLVNDGIIRRLKGMSNLSGSGINFDNIPKFVDNTNNTNNGAPPPSGPDEPYGAYELTQKFGALSGAGAQNRMFYMKDNHWTGNMTNDGHLGFISQFNSHNTFIGGKPPFYVGETVWVLQANNWADTFPEYNGQTKIDGIYKTNDGRWIIDTTKSWRGNTGQVPAIISSQAIAGGNATGYTQANDFT